jgi:hypothetical protein
MAKYTGNSLAIEYGSAITANLVQSVTISESGDVHESTGVGDAAKTYLTGHTDSTVQIEMWDDATPATVRDKFDPGTSDTLDIYPQGKTGGKPKISMTALVTARSSGIEHAGVTPLSVTMQVTGAITESTYTT